MSMPPEARGPVFRRQQTEADRAAVLGKDEIGRRQAGDAGAGNAADKLPS